MDLAKFIGKQRRFSRKTFGPGARLHGVTHHIEKEVAEVRASEGKDLSEWADVILLALDGAWRAGHSAPNICRALETKLAANMKRNWPDWRTAGEGPIEHMKE